MVDTFTLTTNKSIKKPDYNQYINNWNTPVNADWDIIDAALGGQSSNSFTGSDWSMTVTEAQKQRLVLTGALTANVNVILPLSDANPSVAVGGMWIIDNQTTNTFSVTVKTAVAGSVGVVVEQSKKSLVYSDGTNCYFADDRVAGGGATGGGSNQVFFENDLTVTTSYTIPSNKNAMTAGPITIDSGVTVTIQSPSTWTIV